MPLDEFQFNPEEGLANATVFPTEPTDEAAARAQFMVLFNQIKAYMNDVLKVAVDANTCPPVAVITDETYTVSTNDIGKWLVMSGTDQKIIIPAETFPDGAALIIFQESDSQTEVEAAEGATLKEIDDQYKTAGQYAVCGLKFIDDKDLWLFFGRTGS